jgi:redox-sensitive bicupin YhaK (pirin superfamily)
VKIHQDAAVYAALLDGAERASHTLAPGRKAYVHVARGKITVNNNELVAGDALKASGEATILLERGDRAEILLFDLP